MKLILTLILSMVAFAGIASAQNTLRTPLLNGSVGINAGHIWSMPFRVTANDGTVEGSFRAQGGGNNDIYCAVVSELEFENLRNGNDYRVYYETGRVTVAEINLRLPRGNFRLVLSNAHSLLTAKTVYGQIDLIQTFGR